MLLKSRKAEKMAMEAKLFTPDEELLQIWANFTEKSDEKCFRKFVKVSTSYPASRLNLEKIGRIRNFKKHDNIAKILDFSAQKSQFFR